MLLEAGDNANQKNRRNQFVLDIALEYQHMDIANLLLAYGAKRPEILGN